MQLFQTLDLEDIEKTFSAYQKQDGGDGETPNRQATVRRKELSVIDGRRAQNCTILLSKIKMTNEDLASAVFTMDSREELPKDMCEQVCT